MCHLVVCNCQGAQNVSSPRLYLDLETNCLSVWLLQILSSVFSPLGKLVKLNVVVDMDIECDLFFPQFEKKNAANAVCV